MSCESLREPSFRSFLVASGGVKIFLLLSDFLIKYLWLLWRVMDNLHDFSQEIIFIMRTARRQWSFCRANKISYRPWFRGRLFRVIVSVIYVHFAKLAFSCFGQIWIKLIFILLDFQFLCFFEILQSHCGLIAADHWYCFWCFSLAIQNIWTWNFYDLYRLAFLIITNKFILDVSSQSFIVFTFTDFDLRPNAATAWRKLR